MRTFRFGLAAACGLVGAALIGAPSEAQTLVGMANPASTYCQSIGGRSELRKTPEGVSGFCHLPDGKVMPEWDLYRRSLRSRN